MRRRGLLLLGGGAAASIGAALTLAPGLETPPPPGSGMLAFPGLAARLPQAAMLEVRRNDATLLVRRDGNRWVLPDRNNHPIREARLRELLTGLSELRLVESRGADPANLARFGVDDPMTPGSTASHLRLLDSQGAPIIDVTLGRRRMRTQGNVPETIYIRRGTEAEAWLAEGRIPLEGDAASWMERDVANFPAERVLRASIRRVGALPLTLGRAAAGSPLIVTNPPDPPSLNRAALDDVARAFEYLTFMDAVPEAQTPGTAQGEARFELTEGLVVQVWASRLDQFLFIRLKAEGGNADGLEARLLNARWESWAYQVGIWKEKAFLPTLEELTESR